MLRQKTGWFVTFILLSSALNACLAPSWSDASPTATSAAFTVTAFITPPPSATAAPTPPPTSPPPSATAAPTPPPPTSPPPSATAESPTPQRSFRGVALPFPTLPEPLQGQLLLPGFTEAEGDELLNSSFTFTNKFNLSVEVYDPTANQGDENGAGIEQITFEVKRAADDQVVYRKIETKPAYCIFGGDDPNCPELNLREAVNWPNTQEPIIRDSADTAYKAVFTFATNVSGELQLQFDFVVKNNTLAKNEVERMPLSSHY